MLRVNKWIAYALCWGFICIGAALCCYGIGMFVVETRVQEPVVRDWSTNPENGVSGVEIDTDDNASYPETGNGDATGGSMDETSETESDGSQTGSEQEVNDDGEA